MHEDKKLCTPWLLKNPGFIWNLPIIKLEMNLGEINYEVDFRPK